MPNKKTNSENSKPTKGKKAVKNEKPPKRELSPIENAIIPYILVFITLIMLCCYILTDFMGILGVAVKSAMFGLFSLGGWFVPLYIVMVALYWQKDSEDGTRFFHVVAGIMSVLCISVLRYVATLSSADYDLTSYSITEFYKAGYELYGGGVVGGTVGWLFLKFAGSVGTLLVFIFVLLLLTIFVVGFTPKTLFLSLYYSICDAIEKKQHRADEKEAIERRSKQRQLRPVNTFDGQATQLQQQPQPVQQDYSQNNIQTVPKTRHNLFGRDVSIDDTSVSDRTRENLEQAAMENTADENIGSTSVDSPVVIDDDYRRKEKDSRRIPLFDDFTSKKVAQAVQSVDNDNVDEGNDDDGVSDNEAIDDFPSSELYPDENQQIDILDADAPVQNGYDLPFDIDDTAIEDNLAIDDNSAIDTECFDELKNSAISQEQDNPLSEDIIRRVQDSLNEEKKDNFGNVAETEADDIGNIDDFIDDPITEVEYVFPPLTLLNSAPPPPNDDISEELQTTAKTIVSTLESFKIGTKIVNVSRGPTITRYELVPSEGVRVRSIINSIDDIALNLAATGVRIEAPIPGKQAIGIEVPNRNVSTVWLRELIDTQKFRDASSRLNLCLGADVAGDPVYIDIAKMPHLLISGATGMGKSVCINSLIVSLLYKATPDEVKLILIDPKKVELNIYNGLPHLLVPVVSDPKKAAGSLSWAVGEMERRFTLIEEVGMRNIEGYNNVAKDDPGREILPKIVIIIDELADLMMMARDSVEESICRIAQKARAAGMHLIIGTQRPSVDVITGLIKANVPSRIAFRMASQVDSRTVIDITGAEKLIGRGDMLYAPVGSTKPLRVQGSFVGENEIDKIITFIKEHSGDAQYDDEVIDGIEREAAKCNSGKKGSGDSVLDEIGDNGEGEETDPMFKPAVELAIEYGKISVSLLQTRLKLGHGRAARLVYHMQQRGIVSAPDGQKPRTTLITRAQYNEMLLNHDSKLN